MRVFYECSLLRTSALREGEDPRVLTSLLYKYSAPRSCVALLLYIQAEYMDFTSEEFKYKYRRFCPYG